MVVDASVVVSRLVQHDVHHEASRRWLTRADAVYIAAAAGLQLPLVTWDLEQRDRAARVIEVFAPEDGE